MLNRHCRMLVWLFAAALWLTLPPREARSESLPDRTGRQWAPFVEWSLPNATFDGNPFDLRASVLFTHEASGAKRKTEMFYAGASVWKFRFAGTLPGRWTLTTSSDDADLHGRSGVVTIAPDENTSGFVSHIDNKWARPRGAAGKLKAFAPQFVMYGHPASIYKRVDRIDADIETFIRGHGFTGFHVPVFCRWFDIESDRSSAIRSMDPNPDDRTFVALEALITKTHAAGGVVHFWAWGDESRRQTPAKWGINGKVDRRLQRYIAARLGPLPGWTMGYGFDLDEWVNEKQLARWRDYMHAHMGWNHMLGGRHGDPNRGLDHSRAVSWNRPLDYSSYEHHRPTYKVYRASLEAVPGQPVLSEDRFRIRKSRQYRNKDYTEEMTRRGLWHATMAGGVANIWGRLDGDLAINMGDGSSLQYEHPQWIRTWADFFEHRFHADLQPAARLSNGLCLRRGDSDQFIFYRDDTDSIRMNLTSMSAAQPAVAIDTKRKHQPIRLGRLPPKEQNWTAPHKSDWAIAVGDTNIK
ncbi:MAG: DUF5060 domain-containing protein [Pirellulaceae bacterium]|jgi:hypothetical protein|nr:DUF5060 domain-containing protein [Pirellulaceae bacterium]